MSRGQEMAEADPEPRCHRALIQTQCGLRLGLEITREPRGCHSRGKGQVLTGRVTGADCGAVGPFVSTCQ